MKMLGCMPFIIFLLCQAIWALDSIRIKAQCLTPGTLIGATFRYDWEIPPEIELQKNQVKEFPNKLQWNHPAATAVSFEYIADHGARKVIRVIPQGTAAYSEDRRPIVHELELSPGQEKRFNLMTVDAGTQSHQRIVTCSVELMSTEIDNKVQPTLCHFLKNTYKLSIAQGPSNKGDEHYITDHNLYAALTCKVVAPREKALYGETICDGMWDSVPAEKVSLSIKTFKVSDDPCGRNIYKLVAVTRPGSKDLLIYDCEN